MFYKRGWIEKWGTGTTRMVEFCKTNNTPEPTFSEEFHGFSVVFSFKEPMNSAIQIQKRSSKDQLSFRQQEILEILDKTENMAASAIKQQLKASPSDRTLRYELAKLKEKGIIGSSGSTKTTVWFIVK